MKYRNIIFILTASLVVGCAQENAAEPAAESAAAEPVDFATLLASADTAMGKRQYLLCQSCHTIDAGGDNRVGPNLSGVFGRKAAGAEGFTYSAPLSASGIVWDAATMDQWLKEPAALVPGTTMFFPGVGDAKNRADLIAYMLEATAP